MPGAHISWRVADGAIAGHGVGKRQHPGQAVLPGWTDTDMTRGRRHSVAGFNERVIARTPLGRWGEPNDFSGIAVFLASRASDFVTGAVFTVDGGYTVTA
jgi:2-dehydro-3-deoxy-D-gluconate 5-dehydrogenase